MFRLITDRVAAAKKLQESCDCRHLGLWMSVGSAMLCKHYNFAAVFPELLPFWRDDKDPKTISPCSGQRINMTCKKNCGSLDYKVIIGQYPHRIGCDGCTGHGCVIGLNIERTVAGNPNMLKIWSPNNVQNAKDVPHHSDNHICLWTCPKNPKHEYKASTTYISSGKGCRVCWNHGRYNIDEIKAKFNETHGTMYTYDWDNYIHVFEKIKIICPNHGEFHQRPIDHYNGQKCRQCAVHPKEFTEVLKTFRAVWGDLYEYDESTYAGSDIHMTMICSIHGPFKKTPEAHKSNSGPSGCQACSREQTDSQGVRYVSKLLTLMSITYIREEYFDDLRSVKDGLLYFDFCIYQYRLFKEYDGIQHFQSVEYWGGKEGLLARQISDVTKDRYALENGYSMVRIPYWASPEEIIRLAHWSIRMIEAGTPVYVTYKHYLDQIKCPGHFTAYWPCKE
jgi:very-short-patch-repair endonuclease